VRAISQAGLYPSNCRILDPAEAYNTGAANAAGVCAVGLLCGGFSAGALAKAGCKAIYRDPAELNQRIFSWVESLNPVQSPDEFA
jgi:F0F1-type ATP synthase membrane subunit c/vacuolar-type H+-ATPase subunit K